VRPHKHKMLLLIDELPSLGRMEPLSQALPFMAGYGLRALMIYQDKAQLDAAYGKEQTIWANSHVRIAFAPNDASTAEFLSKHLGKRTVIYSEHSLSGKRFGAGLGNTSINTQRIGRELLTADEFMRLPAAEKSTDGLRIVKPGNMIAIVAGYPPVYGVQPLYFMDETLSARSKLAPPYMPGQGDRGGAAAVAHVSSPTAAAAVAAAPVAVADAPTSMVYDETTEIPEPEAIDGYGDPIDLALDDAPEAQAGAAPVQQAFDLAELFSAAQDSSYDSATLAELDARLTGSAVGAGDTAAAPESEAPDSIDEALALLVAKAGP
jgi:hypothetical protein